MRPALLACRSALALLVLLVLAGAASAETYPGVKPTPLFKTPGGAAYCYVDIEGMEAFGPSLRCWTPNDGFIAGMGRKDTKPWDAYYDTYPKIVHGITKLKGYKPAARTLGYGTSARIRCSDLEKASTCGLGSGTTAFTCRSTRDGLTCKNQRGRGYWIGRYRGYKAI